MNPKVIYLWVVLTTLVSCGKKDYVPSVGVSGETIRFGMPGVVIEAENKMRASGPVNVFPSNTSFGVLGYCLANTGDSNNELDMNTGSVEWGTKAPRSTPHLFYKTEIKYNGAGCYYTGEQKRWYEPENFVYTFFAYYPYAGDYYTVTPNSQDGMGIPKLKFSMPFDTEDVEIPLEVGDIPDAMLAASVDVMRGDGHVYLEFNHLLTGLNFEANNYNEEKELVIHGLRMKGEFYKTIEVTLGGGYAYSSEIYKGTFAFLDVDDSADDVTIEHHQTGVKVGDKTLMLISNLNAVPYLGNDIGLYVDYTVNGESKTNEYIGNVANFMPIAGTIYTVQLNFIGNSFVLNFVVDNNQMWEDGGESNIEFE